jgi:hypothetical protein
MKRAKMNEVPKDYRRNYKEEFVGFLKMFAACTLFVVFIAFMISKF